MMDYARRINDLEEEVADLRATVRKLVTDYDIPPDYKRVFRLQSSASYILGMLLDGQVVSMFKVQQILHQNYRSKPIHHYASDYGSVRVTISKLRDRLRVVPAEVKVEYARGYYMMPEDRERVNAYVKERSLGQNPDEQTRSYETSDTKPHPEPRPPAECLSEG